VRLLSSAVQKRKVREAKAEAPKSAKGVEGQKEKKMITHAGTGKKKSAEEDPDFEICTNEDDVKWAASVLAPLGLQKDGELVAKPPAEVALPILRGMRASESFDGLKNILKTSQVGKIVNGLRRHPDPDVARAAKELIEGWRAACAKPAAKPKAAQPAAIADAKPADTSTSDVKPAHADGTEKG